MKYVRNMLKESPDSDSDFQISFRETRKFRVGMETRKRTRAPGDSETRPGRVSGRPGGAGRGLGDNGALARTGWAGRRLRGRPRRRQRARPARGLLSPRLAAFSAKKRGGTGARGEPPHTGWRGRGASIREER